MKKLLRFFCFTVLFFSLILDGFAIGSPTNVEVESDSDNSIMLTWDEIEGALAYDIYYYDSEGSEDDISTVDLIEENSVIIDSLDIGKTYYFRVIAYDDVGETGDFSEEVSFTFTGNINEQLNDSVDFIFKDAKAISYDKIELEFSTDLDDSDNAIREFKIENVNDMFDSYEVLETMLNDEDSSIIELTLDKNLTIGNEYEIIIVALESTSGANIESGIDNSQTIFVEEINQVNDEDIDLKSAGPSSTQIDDSEIDDSEIDDSEIDDSEKDTVGSIAGTNLTSDDINNTTLGAAANQEKLPQTGPEMVFVLLLSVILGALFFVFRIKKA